MPGALLRPRWIALHVAVVLVAVLFVNLGMWQLRRLDERRQANAAVAERIGQEARPLSELLDEFGNDPEQIASRPVLVRGSYDVANEVVLSPRSRDGRPGHHVLTPLLLDGGGAILVERGWVPFELDTPPVAEAAPPASSVTVTGLLQPTDEATRFGRTADGDRIQYLSAPDTDRLQPQLSVPLLPFSVLLSEQRPPAQELPRTPPAPDLGEGPHLSYALQWFAFTVIVGIGYPFVLRRRLRHARLDEPFEPPDSTARSVLNSSTTSRATTP